MNVQLCAEFEFIQPLSAGHTVAPPCSSVINRGDNAVPHVEMSKKGRFARVITGIMAPNSNRA